MLNFLFKKKAVTSDPEIILQEWNDKGRPVPPPHIVKQQAIREYQRLYNLTSLVETGTYMGDMVEAMRNHFTRIFSIELSRKLYLKASKRFSTYRNIQIMEGDSADRLREIVSQLDNPSLFWLDGHYSGGITAKGQKECPVIEELYSIFSSPLHHIILIDDARLFNGTHDYPSMDELQLIATEKRYKIMVKDDIIRFTPRGEI